MNPKLRLSVVDPRFSSCETRELVAFDQEIAGESLLVPFGNASGRVGQAQIKRLRALRDHRLVQRYLRAVRGPFACVFQKPIAAT